MNQPWQEILTESRTGHHIAQVYKDQKFLSDAVTFFISKGLEHHEAVVLIVTKAHWLAFHSRLKKQGLDPAFAIQRGQLRVLDAHDMLSRFVIDGTPDWGRFKNVIAPIFEKIQSIGRYPKIRAYGEMVDILWRKGNLNGAVRLEELWNDMISLYPFSLFCAYTMDPLDKDIISGPIQHVCRTHTHLIPTPDYVRFDEAFSEACSKVMGCSLAQMLRTLAASQQPLHTHMPKAQAALLWMREHMPLTAEKVLVLTKAHLEGSSEPDLSFQQN